MRRKWLFVFITFLLGGCTPAPSNHVQPTTTPVTPTSSPTISEESVEPIDDETEVLAAEFLTLRPAVGQFNGGSWNEAVDQWMGQKHTVMIELGAVMGNGRYTCTQLTELLQEPDHTAKGGDSLHNSIQTLPIYETIGNEAAQFLIYEWRGTHDFLFFVCENGRITASDWWYAGE